MKRFAKHLARDLRGAIAIEFALLAPVLITMMVGVFHMGVYMQNYNAVRSIASDAARYTMVEYQKGNELTTTQIRSVVLASAVNTPYMLDSDRLTISVREVGTSRVTDATELDLDITYTMEDWLPFVTLPATTLTYSRPIFVVET
ncbi:TadE/TadG family type IV pilus assembly protein [Erythrobacter sp. HKB08]|uniref:TadE/TadG family type IV pilus assembly protein n=1 Tax=Erythrobacter sp. HKB08 TaxID=2502843 RepID=UPI0010088A76|nr:TadE family protein [Erythrobacter sp. HKB08]